MKNAIDDYTVVGDGKRVFDGTIDVSSSDTTLTSASNPFVSGDVGKSICVKGAGASGADLITTIASYNSGGSVELSNAASTDVGGAQPDAEVSWGTDDTSQLQAVLDAGEPVYLPQGIYIITSELQVSDGSKLIGAGAFWKRRTGYKYDGSNSAVLLFHGNLGSSGSKNCAVRVSELAVGTKGTDFTADPYTHDLLNCRIENVHIDANNRAYYAWYVYRAGNQSALDRLSAERSVRANHAHFGCYAAFFGPMGSFESDDEGVLCGTDELGWGDAEATNFAYYASFHTCNNADGGGEFRCGRGSRVTIISENNTGRACSIEAYPIATGTGGPSTYHLDYIESNGDGVLIDGYYSHSEGMTIDGGFIHPNNNTIDIVANSTNAGPTDKGQWIRFRNLHGDVDTPTYLTIDSNSNKFVVEENCDTRIVFSNKSPASRTIENRIFDLGDNTLTGTVAEFDAAISNGAIPQETTGSFTITLKGETTSGSNGSASGQQYIRIGDLVSLFLDVNLSSFSGTGNLKFTGLPFSSALGSYCVIANLDPEASSNFDAILMNMQPGSSEARLFKKAIGSSISRLQDTDEGAYGWRFVGTITYRAS